MGTKVTIGHQAIIKEREVICVSYKWEGEDEVYWLEWDEKTRSDKELLKKFADVLFQADEVVGHNSDYFDIKWLRGRAAFHRIPFPTYLKSLDTYVKSKSAFNLPCLKLDYLASYFNVGGKISTGGMPLWHSCMFDTGKKYKESMNTMTTYCNNDVIILEKVFNAIKNYIKLNTHVGVVKGREKYTSPLSGSKNVEHVRNWVTTAGTVQRIMRDKDTGAEYKISNTSFSKMNE